MLGSPLASPSVDTNSSSPFKDAPPTDRPYKDLTDRQTRYQKAVCVVNAPGKFAVTGTLLMCRGQCCVLFGDQANALVPRDAGQATAVFYSNGGSESTAEAKLMPHLLWCPRAEFGLILCAVDGEPLRAPRVWPLVPSPDALYKGVREANGDAKKAPECQLYGHIDGAAKRSLTLYVDDYDRQSDRIYFRFAPPVETHGCPIFYEGRWVGNVTTETEPNRSVVVPGEHRPLYVNKTDRGIGVGVVLASLGCAGVPAEQWPPEPQSDSDSDASENRPATPPPLNTPFERPRLPEPEFNGYAGHHVFDRSKRGRSYIGGSGIALRARLGDGPRNRPTGRARHDLPARAIKAVHEANIEALAELQAEDDDPNFLRDLRLARGWTLAHVAATTGNGAMLVPLAECGVDLKAATPLGDTVAHTAAYHGCIGALRVLKNRGIPINAENNRGERPVHKALLRRHEACVAWFKRRRCAIPVLPKAVDEDDGSGFLPRSAVAVAASVHGPRPEVDPAAFLPEAFGL